MSVDDFGPTLDEFPLSVEPNPMMVVQLATSNNAPVEITDQDAPIEEQLLLEPGEFAFVMLAQSNIDNDVAIVKLVAPAAHESKFPDWVARTQKEWVLCEWCSHGDHEREDEVTWRLGWFERRRLIKISPDQAHELTGMIVDAGKHRDFEIGDFPDWLADLYHHNADEIVDQRVKKDPSKKPVTCPSCQSTEVQLHGNSSMILVARAGVQVDEKGKETYINLTEPDIEKTLSMHLHCDSCHSVKQLEPGEFHIH